MMNCETKDLCITKYHISWQGLKQILLSKDEGFFLGLNLIINHSIDNWTTYEVEDMHNFLIEITHNSIPFGYFKSMDQNLWTMLYSDIVARLDISRDVWMSMGLRDRIRKMAECLIKYDESAED